MTGSGDAAGGTGRAPTALRVRAQGRARPGNPFGVFRHYNYRLYWSGQLVSQIGTWMQAAGQAWLVLQLTNSAFLLSLVTACQTLPMLFFSLVAGAVADRVPKRPLLLVTQTTMMLQAFILAWLVWSGRVAYWHIAMLATILGIARSFDIPTRQSFVIEMVGREDLMAAIALNSSIVNGARIFGPALAGLVMAAYGAGWAFFLNGLSFLAIIYGLLKMRLDRDRRAPGERRSLWRDVLAGLAYVRREVKIFLVLLLLGFISTFVQNYNLVVPVLAKQALGQTAAGYGFMMSAMGLGAVIASLSLASVGGREPDLRWLFGAAGLLSGLTLVMAAVTSYPLAVAIMVFIGALNMIYMASSNTAVQVTVPDNLRGRVMSMYNLVQNGASPIGSLLLGVMMSRYGPRAGWTTAGGVGLLSMFMVTGLAAVLYARRGRGRGASSVLR